MLTVTELHVALTHLVNTQIALLQSLGRDMDPHVGDVIVAQRELFDALFAVVVALESRQAQHLQGMNDLQGKLLEHTADVDVHRYAPPYSS